MSLSGSTNLRTHCCFTLTFMPRLAEFRTPRSWFGNLEEVRMQARSVFHGDPGVFLLTRPIDAS